MDLRREGISHAQLSRCFSLNHTTSHRWEKALTNQIEDKVWRKQAVDFAENLANEQCAMMPNTLWAGDITYIPTDEGWLYLAIVIDLFSRLIVGWSVFDTKDSCFCIQALQLAIHRRKPPSEVIFHSDRGSQYSSQAFRNVLTEAKMVHAKVGQGNVQTMRSQSDFFGV